jgi:hypothetical protein
MACHLADHAGQLLAEVDTTDPCELVPAMRPTRSGDIAVKARRSWHPEGALVRAVWTAS